MMVCDYLQWSRPFTEPILRLPRSFLDAEGGEALQINSNNNPTLTQQNPTVLKMKDSSIRMLSSFKRNRRHRFLEISISF